MLYFNTNLVATLSSGLRIATSINLRQNKLSGDGVSEGIGGGLKLEFLRKRPVKDREAVSIYDEQVDGACSPGSVRIPQNPFDFQRSLQAFDLVEFDEIIDRQRARLPRRAACVRRSGSAGRYLADRRGGLRCQDRHAGVAQPGNAAHRRKPAHPGRARPSNCCRS